MQNGNSFVNKYLKILKIQIIFLYLIIKVDIKLEVYYTKKIRIMYLAKKKLSIPTFYIVNLYPSFETK